MAKQIDRLLIKANEKTCFNWILKAKEQHSLFAAITNNVKNERSSFKKKPFVADFTDQALHPWSQCTSWFSFDQTRNQRCLNDAKSNIACLFASIKNLKKLWHFLSIIQFNYDAFDACLPEFTCFLVYCLLQTQYPNYCRISLILNEINFNPSMSFSVIT